MDSKVLEQLREFDPDSLEFLLFSNEDIKKLSVAKISNITTFDAIGNPTKGGLYDSALGPIRDRNDFCSTCSKGLLFCPGHFGHIELPLIVVNPLFIKTIYTIFRISCLKCYRIQFDEQTKAVLKLQLKLIDAGHVTEALDLCTFIADIKMLKEDLSDEHKVFLKKYKKLLKQTDTINELFHNKNTDRLRSKIINEIIRPANVSKKCLYCQCKLIKVRTVDNKLMYNLSPTSTYADKGKGMKILMPDEIKDICSEICKNDANILKYCIPVLSKSKTIPVTDIFFMQVVPVLPPCVRPCNVMQGELIEHPQTNVYKGILTTCFQAEVVLQVLSGSEPETAVENLDSHQRQLYDNVAGGSPLEKLHTIWQLLQKNVIYLLDCEGEKASSQGLKQVIEKKTGVIRMHMMGKRVNFAARSVITPDPNVDIDEIGVPDVFATKLTYPVPVTEWNVDELRNMVINGPNQHPGADRLVLDNGRVVKIPPDSIKKRQSIAKRLLTADEYKSSKSKVVHRHLIDGDVLILNRQPSLHKPSMMAHRAKILQGEKTLRLHYANCKSYNADFDGDEMNAHFPQNEIARSEAYNILSVTKQYLVPKDGTPLSGLIQDHVISGVKMSVRGEFFSKSDYQQLVFQALHKYQKGRIKLLPPAIIKPKMLWSGKQVLSTIIINIIPKGKPYLSLDGKAKISSNAWQKYPPRDWKVGTKFVNSENMSEAEVIIRKGELLCGVLDKTHYGATPYGLVHCMYELYGGDTSSALLSSFSKVFTFYLQWIGFSLGVKDILVLEKANKERDKYIEQIKKTGKIAATQATDLPENVDDEELKNTIEEMLIKDPKFRSILDNEYKTLLDTYTNKINSACLTEGLLEKFPYNNLQLMVQSGAKGSTVNTMQISCLLGQIELEGKRPPLMISGKTLPSFLPHDPSPRAGGFIDGRFMTGIQPQEFFFHCMAGREGLIDTAVKTSRSGYLQRCLIKHLEGLSIGYDHTVRDSDGSVIQFAYGEDTLDVLKCQFLKQKQLKFLDINSNIVGNKNVLKKLKKNVDFTEVAKLQKSDKKWCKRNKSTEKTVVSPFTLFSSLAKNDVDLNDVSSNITRDPYYWGLEKLWRSLDEDEKKEYTVKRRPEPILSKLSPTFKFGVVNEKLNTIIENYLKNRTSISQYTEFTDKEKFQEMVHCKYLESMAAPGEPVGLLAAQSIGEPSTQMTLNTFHFAGRGDMNVTLGIPRLREILMTASAKLKTPNMDIPFIASTESLKKKAERLRKKLNKVTVNDVLEKISLQCEIVDKPNRALCTTMHFDFLPQRQYSAQFAVKPKQIIDHMKNKFFSEMFSTIKKQAKTSCGVVWSSEGNKKSQNTADSDDENENVTKDKDAKTTKDEDSSDSDSANEDDDNTDVKIRNKRNEEQEYDDPESGEEEEKLEDGNDLEDVQNESFMPDAQIDPNDEKSKAEEQKIASEVIQNLENVVNYKYDTQNYEWCELTVSFPVSFLRVDLSQALKDTAAKSIIHEVKNIKKAFITDENGSLHLKTEGINIIQMFKYNHLLDLNKIYSNDIHAVANTYGIEAANKVIIKEIQNVFNVYGITVDPRHLSLVADYMTYNGVFEAMNRKSMEASTSPLQQMSFESSMIFLKDAVLNAKKDNIRSATSTLMLGQPMRCGTGAFSIHLETDPCK